MILCNSSNDKSSRRVSLHTEGFTIEECEFLVSKLLTQLGIKSKIYKNKIRIVSESYQNFIELVEPYVIWKCFNYKIVHNFSTPQFGETAHMAKLTEKQVIKIFQLVENGKKQKDVAKIFNISKSSVSAIITGKNWKYLK